MSLSPEEKENSVKPLIKIEWVPIILSSLALAISLVTFYFQFFHVSESIKAAATNMDIAKNQKSGPIVLNIALVNGGNRDALIPGCTLTSDRITFDLERPAEAPMILKAGEVKPRVLRGTFTFNANAPNGVAPVFLNCEIVGSRGYDLKSQQPISILVIRDGTIAEDHFLPLPVRLQ
jgi:hypothetical protein